MKYATCSRRKLIGVGSAAFVGSAFRLPNLDSAERVRSPFGYVVGEPTAEIVGQKVLVEGGNAIDAIVAAAMAAAVAAPNQTGIGGYGMSAICSVDFGKSIFGIDGNSAAPAAMQADIFRSVADGTDKDQINESGWLAAGVPGILAGLQLAIDRFGTRSLSELIQPAIDIARRGYPWPKQLAAIVAGNKFLSTDPGSRSIYFKSGRPLKAGETFTNPQLADLLESLAEANSVNAFYRGDIAQQIADAFEKNGGLVTAQDLANYEARLVKPLSLSWNDLTVHTPPLTSGGMTVLQIMNTLKVMNWDKISNPIHQLHAKIEATRLAWNDRLTLLGDPQFGTVPVERLLSDGYAHESVERIDEVVRKQSYLEFPDNTKTQGGTISLSAVDRNGTMAALTLTHGNAFGAKVSVDGLGLTLGHGMSRFDPRPNHPNAPGPGKRPLHNMVPTVVTRADKALVAIGGRGGRKIVNAVLDTLVPLVALGESLTQSIKRPRMHTEGNTSLFFESSWPKEPQEAIKAIGYDVKHSASATLSAVGIEDEGLLAAMR